MAKAIDITLKLIDKCSSPLKGVQKGLTEHANQWTRAGRQIQRAGKNIERVGFPDKNSDRSDCHGGSCLHQSSQ